MRGNILFLFVEGDDDKRFFEGIVGPKLKKDIQLRIWQYSQVKQQKTDNFVKSTNRLGEYLFIKDKDSEPCIRVKKQKIVQEIVSLEIDKIVIVNHEIESWYIAGLNVQKCQELKIKFVTNAEKLTKEQFNRALPKKPRIEMLPLIIENYDIETAKCRNSSFRYLMRKLSEQGFLV